MNTIFDQYKKALMPESLADVIPMETLRMLMRGFIYSDRVGISLLYKR